MYRIEISGCLTSLILLLIAYFLVKELWWFFVGIVLILIAIYFGNLIYNVVLQKYKDKDQNYNPQMGEVYKICPYCNTQVKANAQICPCCNKNLN